MHISDVQETNKKILTKCTNMTEDIIKIHGTKDYNNRNGTNNNGNNKSHGQGGRLKFFKGIKLNLTFLFLTF